MIDFDAKALREQREQMRAWADTKERHGKYRKAFVRSMRASLKHWRIRLAAGRARLYPLALALAICLVPGCTDAQLSDTLHVVKDAVKWSCPVAATLCAKDDDVACAVIAAVCGIAQPLLDATVTEATSGGEDGVISEEP